MTDFVRELRFAGRDTALRLAVIATFLLSAAAVVLGIAEVREQHAAIEALIVLDEADRSAALADQSDYGSAAYYAFHLTYDPPSDLAFAALGRRQDLPWRHRIRMLALEGQIYEADTGSPTLARAGRLDFAFVASVLAPLLVLLTLHDLVARERVAGRRELLEATGGGGHVFAWRASVRAGLIGAALTLPFIIGAIVLGAPVGGTLAVAAVALGHVAVWAVLALVVAKRTQAGPTAAAKLAGLWLFFVIAVPLAGRAIASATVPVPAGGEILLTQREAVNDAWDLPKEDTLNPFVERHPEWAGRVAFAETFEWKWYYAFQQVGDQVAEPLSTALREGIARRDDVMNLTALASPTLATERLLTRLARTDTTAAQAYEVCVRNFHAQLRTFHYPLLFGGEAYDVGALNDLPTWRSRPCGAPSVRS